jgi:hypothetical protein
MRLRRKQKFMLAAPALIVRERTKSIPYLRGMSTLLSHSNSPTVCCVCFQAIRLLAKRTTADEVPHTCTST